MDLGSYFANTAVHGTTRGLAVEPVEYASPTKERRAACALEAV